MTVKCQVCGTENPDDAKYCDGCGVELKPAAPAAAPTPPAPAPTPAAPEAAVPAPDAVVGGVESAVAATPTPAAETGTVGNGEPNPYQTPLSETPLGKVDEPVPAPAAPVAAPPAPGAEAPAPAASAPAETPAPAPDPVVAPAATTPAAPEPAPAPAPVASPVASDAPAKLGLKKYGQPTGEFIPLQGEKLVVGRFDASSGPVDIDLGEMAGKEHISRHHAELYKEGGVWHVRDLGSTNGVFIKKKGESTFSPRLQEPAALADGDELAFGNVMLTFNQG